MNAFVALPSPMDVREFIHQYFAARRGTAESRIMSYYATDVQLRIPGLEIERRRSGSRTARPSFHHRFSG
jgi:hypothetical protein